MRRTSHYQEIAEETSTPHVVTIGNFDGVHIGHRALLKAARRRADSLGVSLAVLTFEPHPAEILKPGTERLRLVTPDRKSELLAACGVELALFQRFDADFAALDAEEFVRAVLREALLAKLVYVGENFRFGRGRGAGVGKLSRFGRKYGFDVYSAELIQKGSAAVSSSRIREVLADGDVRAAAKMLGRFHEVGGTVVRDRQIGQTMGFPTINLKDVDVMFPKSGIYAALVDIDSRTVPAAAYIGDRPTMGAGFSIEAHLLDFSGELYQARATIRFVDRIRDDQKFDTTDQLAAQIASDIARIREILAEIND
jgi:riboflavin kinase / FMN adenylyltransferase